MKKLIVFCSSFAFVFLAFAGIATGPLAGGGGSGANPTGNGSALTNVLGTKGIYYVDDNGAVHDGTTDDWAAIQTLINTASNNGGGTVVLGGHSGQYHLSQSLIIGTNVNLIGQGKGQINPDVCGPSTLQMSSVSIPILILTNVVNATVQGISFTNSATMNQRALVVENATSLGHRVNFLSCSFYNGFDQLQIFESELADISDCDFGGVISDRSISLKNSVNVDAGDNHFSHDSFIAAPLIPGTSSIFGLYIESSGGSTVTDCKFNGRGGNNEYTYQLVVSANGGNSSILLVKGCSFENFTTGGFITTSADGSTYTLISVVGCEFFCNSATAGAFMNQGIGNYGSFVGDIFENALGNCISLSGMTGVSIVGCTSTSGATILSDSTGSGNTVIGPNINDANHYLNGVGTYTQVSLANGVTDNLSTLKVGAATNTASFTLTQTNWIDGKLYTNTTGRTMFVWAPCFLTFAAVSGNASYNLEVTNTTTNFLSQTTSATSLAVKLTNSVYAYVPAGSTFAFTNRSAGAGDSAAILTGGQFMVY